MDDITNSWSSRNLTSIESVMPSSHLTLCRPLLLLPAIPPSSRCFPITKLCLTPCDPMDCSTPLSLSLSFTSSQSLLRFMSLELVMLSNHFILC